MELTIPKKSRAEGSNRQTGSLEVEAVQSLPDLRSGPGLSPILDPRCSPPTLGTCSGGFLTTTTQGSEQSKLILYIDFLQKAAFQAPISKKHGPLGTASLPRCCCEGPKLEICGWSLAPERQRMP